MKKSLIVINTFKKEAAPLGMEIEMFLADRGVTAELFRYDGQTATENDKAISFEGYDFVVTLGGDGTVLFASRACAPLDIPVFPVNLGEFGFIAGVQKNEWQSELDNFLAGNAQIASRSLVKAIVLRKGRTVFDCVGMNDIVIGSASSVKIVNVDVAYNNAPLGRFKADGIIVATATGSTAYSAAAGGPIIDPSLDVLVLTPINSFSLSARPLVLNPQGELAVTVLPSRVPLELTADGQIPFALAENDCIKMRIAQYKARLVCSTQEKFFAALRSKLNWSGGPLA